MLQGTDLPGWRYLMSAVCGVATLVAAAVTPAVGQSDDADIALSLANLLRSARAVISANQDLINSPDIVDKDLTGDVVLKKAMLRYKESTGRDLESLDPDSLKGKLLAAQMAAVKEIVDENQTTINQPGVGFKGFVPAVFARLVNERFESKVGQQAAIKVTAPRELVRNRKALPDAWESEAIEGKLSAPDWPKGQVLSMEIQGGGRKAFRVLVPEYYSEGCLSCHGEPKGEIDVTGYPKEGGHLGQLGGAISVTLFR